MRFSLVCSLYDNKNIIRQSLGLGFKTKLVLKLANCIIAKELQALIGWKTRVQEFIFQMLLSNDIASLNCLDMNCKRYCCPDVMMYTLKKCIDYVLFYSQVKAQWPPEERKISIHEKQFMKSTVGKNGPRCVLGLETAMNLALLVCAYRRFIFEFMRPFFC